MNLPHKPRKRFGQHFLNDAGVITQIINAINPQPSEHLVEIGPGEGVLTKLLLPAVKRLDAVEIDRDLVTLLTQKFPSLHLHNQDVLTFDFATLANTEEKLHLVGNLPYNISTPLLFHVFATLKNISVMHFMLQKEVVDRLCAPVGDKHYNRLSVMSQYFCRSENLFIIPPQAFTPPPRVMSAFVRMTPNPPNIPAKNLALFSQIVKNAFMYRRKTLSNSLKEVVSAATLTNLGINPQLRAQNLSVEQYVTLSNSLA